LARHLGRGATRPYRTKKRIQQKQKVKTVIKNGAQELCPEPERATAGFVRQSKIQNPKSPKAPFFKAFQRLSKKKMCTRFENQNHYPINQFNHG
jgi:hypothetical protein